MAYNEKTAERIREVLVDNDRVTEVKMMGSLVFMVNGHMCCGATGEQLMVRVGPDTRESMLKKPHVVPLQIGGGRAPSAFICVEAPGHSTQRALSTWVNRGLSFVLALPPKARKKKATRKKTAKKTTGKKSTQKKSISKKTSNKTSSRKKSATKTKTATTRRRKSR